MASTYSNLKIQLMATGENSGTWGNVTNVNLGTAIEQAMVESATVTFSSANVTLTLTDTNAAQNARALRLNLTGTTGGARDLIVPAIQKPYIVNNGTADTITIKVSGQTGIAVPASKTMLVYNNGTDVVDAINHLSALSLGTALPIASGGTGSTSTTYANLQSNVTGTLPVANGGTSATTLTAESVVVGNGTSAVKFVAPGTDGNVLTSNGTAWVSEAIVIPPSVPTGTIAAFAGDPGAGWLECNGQIVSQSTYSDLYAKVGLLADAFQTTSYVFLAGLSDSNMISNIVYGNSTYVIGQTNGGNPASIYSSTDAITWTARSVNWVSGMAYSRAMLYTDKFVSGWVISGTAETNGNKIATSTDGITWTVRTVPTSITSHVTNLAWNGSNTIVAGFNSGRVATSTDGITWTARTFAVTSVDQNTYVAYGNSVFVAVSDANNGNNRRNTVIQTSTDGITWTFRSVGWNNTGIRAIRYVNNRFWLTLGTLTGSYGGMSTFYTSTDGITWTQNTSLETALPNAVLLVYDSTNSLTYALGYGSPSVFSAYTGVEAGGLSMAISNDDGATWNIQPIGTNIIATSTNNDPAPASGVGTPLISYAGGAGTFSLVNNRLVVAGYYTNFNTGGGLSSSGYIQTFTNFPYTYQTDTQFAVPTSLGAAGTAFGGLNSSARGRKFSEAAPFTSARNIKYYIKT